MLRFSLDDREVRAAFDAAPKQARFAAAQALTDVAGIARDQVVAELGEMFTLRSGWIAKGLRVVAANNSTMEAVLGSKDSFMERQAVGGTKEPGGGKSHVPVPVGARPRRTDITRPGKWPGRLPGAFVAPLSTGGLYMGVERVRRDGSEKVRRSTSYQAPGAKIRPADRGRTTFGTLGVWQRFGGKVIATRGRYKGQKRQRIKLMYVLPDEVHIDDPRFRIREIAERVARERYLSAFHRRFALAVGSAR